MGLKIIMKVCFVNNIKVTSRNFPIIKKKSGHDNLKDAILINQSASRERERPFLNIK